MPQDQFGAALAPGPNGTPTPPQDQTEYTQLHSKWMTFLTDPKVQAAMFQFGTSMLANPNAGFGAALGTSLQDAAGAYTRVQANQTAQQQAAVEAQRQAAADQRAMNADARAAAGMTLEQQKFQEELRKNLAAEALKNKELGISEQRLKLLTNRSTGGAGIKLPQAAKDAIAQLAKDYDLTDPDQMNQYMDAVDAIYKRYMPSEAAPPPPQGPGPKPPGSEGPPSEALPPMSSDQSRKPGVIGSLYNDLFGGPKPVAEAGIKDNTPQGAAPTMDAGTPPAPSGSAVQPALAAPTGNVLGSRTNPYPPMTPEQAAALPKGSWVRMPDGTIRQRL